MAILFIAGFLYRWVVTFRLKICQLNDLRDYIVLPNDTFSAVFLSHVIMKSNFGCVPSVTVLHVFVQIGGSDQLGNIVSGYELITRVTNKPVFGIFIATSVQNWTFLLNFVCWKPALDFVAVSPDFNSDLPFESGLLPKDRVHPQDHSYRCGDKCGARLPHSAL